MIGRTKSRATPDLGQRLAALREAVDLADGRLDPAVVDSARAVAARAGERLGLGADQTVAALAGATGSGKSSLFNAMSGVDLSQTGVRRPTTSTAHACVWGGEDADALLDWLGVGHRHRLDPDAEPELAGLVLLDLPDHDSTQQAHRVEVDRLVELVDLLVWVLDPQKYADAAVHDRYLRPLAGHAAVMVVVLNQVDLLPPAARASCLEDLRRLLAADGLPGVPVVATSVRTGEGLAELRALLTERVAARQAAADRLAADVDREAQALVAACDPDARPREVSRASRAALVTALSDAAGAEVVVDAVVRHHRQGASGMTGWPFVSWVRKLRPDPLRRLHLTSATPNEAARTSLPQASGVQRARVTNAIRATADSAAEPLPDPWPRLARQAAARHEADLPDLLDRAVAGTRLTTGRRPVWWAVVQQLQRLLAAAAVVGALWLLVLFVFSYFRLPEPPTPEVRRIPWPTLLLIGGVLLGWVVAVISRQAARIGARRRGRLARRRLEERIAELADDRVVAPLQDELSAYGELCGALARARGAHPR